MKIKYPYMKKKVGDIVDKRNIGLSTNQKTELANQKVDINRILNKYNNIPTFDKTLDQL